MYNLIHKTFSCMCVACVISFLGLVGYGPLVAVAVSDDLLEQVYRLPQDIGYAEDADAEDLFSTKLSLGGGNGDGDGEAERSDLAGLNGSVIARAAQFLLRITVLLGIPMIIFAGIKIMLAQGDEAKLKEGLKLLGFVALGIFVALMSVAIVYIIISITGSNLGNI